MATFSLAAKRALEDAHHAKMLKQFALEDDAPMLGRPARASDAADERTLRGIPAIGRGVSGAIPGTRPD